MLRLVILLFILALFVPEGWLPASPYTQASQDRGQGQDVGFGDILTLVQRLGSDLSSLCEREPQVCATSGQLSSQAKTRALAVTSAITQWLEGVGPQGDPVRQVDFGSAAPPPQRQPQGRSRVGWDGGQEDVGEGWDWEDTPAEIRARYEM